MLKWYQSGRDRSEWPRCYFAIGMQKKGKLTLEALAKLGVSEEEALAFECLADLWYRSLVS